MASVTQGIRAEWSASVAGSGASRFLVECERATFEMGLSADPPPLRADPVWAARRMFPTKQCRVQSEAVHSCRPHGGEETENVKRISISSTQVGYVYNK